MQTRVSHPYTTPLAAPPPPLNLIAGQGRGNANLPAFAGARHTLGPTFSEEEDGDDSQFIAEKMAHLGLDRLDPRTRRPENQRPYTPPSNGSRRTRKRQAEYEAHLAQMHAGSALPIRDQNISPPIPHGYGHNQRTQQDLYRQMQQEQYTSLQHQARLALLAAQLQQQQEKHALEQYHKQQTIQQQQQRLFAINQQQPLIERERLAAQVQANLLARTTRQKNLDDAETRARFESVPNTPTNLRSPFGVENTARVSPFARPDSMWSATTPVTVKAEVTSTPSTFSQFRPQPASTPSVQQQAQTKPQGLSAILSRRGQAQTPTLTNDKPADEVYSTESSRTTSATTTLLASPTQISEKDTEEKPESTAIKALGLGRPNIQQNRPARAWSTPSGTATSTAINTPIPTPRSASQPVNTAVHAVRQPFGPPGNMEKLKEENFKSILRKRAGLKLGMLNRRVSPTMPCATLEEE